MAKNIFAKGALLLAVAAAAVSSLSAQSVLYNENWSEYTVGESVVGRGFKWANTPAEGSNANKRTAVIGREANGVRFLSISSYGYEEKGAFTSILGSDKITPQTPLKLSEQKVTLVTTSVRYTTPNASVTSTPYPTVRLFTNGGTFWFGFAGANEFFVTFPSHQQIRSGVETHKPDRSGWYRFTLEMDPVATTVQFKVFQVSALGVETEVWSTNSSSRVRVTEIRNYQLEVSRPGAAARNFGSSDFSGFAVGQKD